jgi:hypothetical protein
VHRGDTPNDRVSGIEGAFINTLKFPGIIALTDPSDKTVIVKMMPEFLINHTKKNTPPLLGTANFLRHFTIMISYSKKIIRLEYD